MAKERMVTVRCAFCQGEGKDPFDLLSELATCQVCGGKGHVHVTEPAIRCVYCSGTGVQPHGVRITCPVCNGKGMVTVREGAETCEDCEGTGRSHDELPCLTCKGKGLT